MTKNSKIIIITISIITLIALFPISITAFAYGMGSYAATSGQQTSSKALQRF